MAEQFYENISKYLKYMENIKSSSPLTLKSYQIDLNQAYKNTELFNSTDWDSNLLKKITTQAMTQWSHLSLASRNRKIATLKSFMNWLYDEKILTKNLADQLVCPKVPKKIPHFISVDEVTSILKYYERADLQANEFNEKMIFLLIYGGGLRISEACQLRWSAIHFDQRSLRIKGKGQKERIVILPEFCIQNLRKFKSQQEQQEFVFGKQPLNPRTGYEWIRTAGVKAQLLNPLHPHALRHSYATHLLSSGANLRTLQTLLGHESLQATEKYTHLTIDTLARMMDSQHPLGKIKI